MFTYAAVSGVGVHEPRNDDRVLIGTQVISAGSCGGRTENSYMTAAVCDGVGGMLQGFRAAEIAAEVFGQLNCSGKSLPDIKAAAEEANQRLRTLQQEENLHNGLRTTVAGLYADGERLFVFNAGDSRVYRLRYKYLTQLSKDHSLVQDLIDLGEISQEEARTHPRKNIISKCLGHEETVHARVVDMSGDLMANDVFFICSDGISDVLSDEEIRDTLFRHRTDENLEQCCKELYKVAVDNGSLDNMSAVLIRKGAVE